MNVLMITRRAHPEVGGVETHIKEVNNVLAGRGVNVRLVTQKNINFPKVPLFGLLYIWLWFIKNRNLAAQADLIHIHDVFIWCLPLRIIFAHKPVYVTFHGWEGKFPIPFRYKWIRQISAKLARGNICVGRYIEKWYGIRATYTTYGAVSKFPVSPFRRNDPLYQFPINSKNSKFKVLYIGRLEEDTGLSVIFDILQLIKEENPRVRIEFLGDGSLRERAQKLGKVHGFKKKVTPYLERADLVFVSGYLTALEAHARRKTVLAVSQNELKYDYWRGFCSEAKEQSWDEVAKLYLKLWRQ